MGDFGGLGGLGGFDVGHLLGALGSSLLTSPREAPLAGLPGAIQARNTMQTQRQSQAAIMTALKQAGFDDQTAMLMAANPQAAQIAITAKNQREADALSQQDFAPGSMFSATAAAPSAAPAPGVPALPSFAVNAGASGDYLSTLIGKESGGNATAANP